MRSAIYGAIVLGAVCAASLVSHYAPLPTPHSLLPTPAPEQPWSIYCWLWPDGRWAYTVGQNEGEARPGYWYTDGFSLDVYWMADLSCELAWQARLDAIEAEGVEAQRARMGLGKK